jgi:hypothetical protein
MDNLQLSRGGSFALASGALANGTTAGTIQTTATIPFTIDGTFASKAATNNVPITMVLDPIYGQNSDGSFTGAVGGSTRLYGLYMDSAGVISARPGPVVNTLDLAAGVVPLQYPQPLKSRCNFGAMRVAVTASTTFVPGVTALNAAGVTTTFVNLMQFPGEPIRV